MPNLPKRVLSAFRHEIVAEALAVCRGWPVADLGQPRIAVLRAAIAAERGELSLASAYLIHAIRLEPSEASAYSELGDLLQRVNRKAAAINAYLHAAKLNPRAADAWCRLAIALAAAKHFGAAELACREGIDLQPCDPHIHASLGGIYLAQGRLEEAAAEHLTAACLAPDDAEWHSQLGRVQLFMRQFEQAVSSFKRGLRLDRRRLDLYLGLGDAFLRLGAIKGAVKAFGEGVCVAPNSVTANQRHLLALELLGCSTDLPSAWVSLGGALERHGNAREAVSAYRRGGARRRNCLRATAGLARSLMALGDWDGAIGAYEKVIALNPARSSSHVEFGMALQRLNEWETGWNELAYFHSVGGPEWPNVEQPLWDGAALDGRSILLWASAPAGEVVQFVRYARFAKACGGRVIVECDSALVPFVRNADGVDAVIAAGAPRPAFDLHAPLRYLPSLVKSARRIPLANGPYLKAGSINSNGVQNEERASTVGLVWATCPEDIENPSATVPLLALMRLGQIAGVRLMGLQRGRHRHQLLALANRVSIMDGLPESCSLQDVVSALKNVSLVISVESVVAHLAAAIGVDVWLLLEEPAPWPWPAKGTQTPWYPTIRIFRRSRLRGWSDVLKTVSDELRERMARLQNSDSAPESSLPKWMS